MLDITPENISGFVTADGCFYADSGYDKDYKLGYQIRIAFCIELREDDRDILEAFMIGDKKHLTKDGLKEILKLKHQLQAINKKGSKGSLDALDAHVQWERTLDSKSPITARQAMGAGGT